MKKLLFLLIGTLLTISLSATSRHKPTAEDIEVFQILMDLKASGDIILPEIHVFANSETKSTIKNIRFHPSYTGKTNGSSIKPIQNEKRSEFRYNRDRLSRENNCRHHKRRLQPSQMILQ